LVVVGSLGWGERHRGQRVVGAADHGDTASGAWRTDDDGGGGVAERVGNDPRPGTR
jgi:hypothetical protein